MHTSHRTNRNTVVAWVSVIALACAYSAGCATGEDTSDEQPNATGGAAGEGGEAGATGDASVGGAAGKGGAAGSSGQAGAGGEAGSAGAQGGAAGEGGSNAGGSSTGGSGTGGSSAGGSSTGGSSTGGSSTGGSSTGGSSTGGSSTGGSSTGGSSTGGAAGSVQMPVGCSIPGYTYDCVPSTNQGCNTGSDEACDYDSNSYSFVCYSAQDPFLNDAGLGEACDLDYGPSCKPTLFCSTDDAYSSTGVCVRYCCSDSDCSGTTKCLGFDPGNGTLGGCYDSSTGGTGGTGGSAGAGGSGTGGSGTGGSAGSGGAGGTSGAGGSAGSGGSINDAGTDVSTGGSTGQGGSTGEGGVPSLYFSEYIEGSSNNKALEIYNAGSSEYDLSTCIVRRYQNGASDPNANPALTIPAGTMLAAGDVFVLCNTLAAQAILDVCDLKNANVNFNGNDAVELVCDSVTVDVFGKIGEDPGTAWGTAPTSTLDTTLVRKCTVTQGDTNGTDAFDPSVEWDGYAKDTFTNLGARNCP